MLNFVYILQGGWKRKRTEYVIKRKAKTKVGTNCGCKNKEYKEEMYEKKYEKRKTNTWNHLSRHYDDGSDSDGRPAVCDGSVR